jgi:membrane protease subunit HflC
MKRILSILGGVLFVLWVLVLQVFFMLDEREQAIITQFGAYVRTVTQPGLHIKAPFVHTVHRFDRRVLATDAQPAEYLTLDKKRVVVDYVARWRIADPLAFFKSVRTLEGARARIEDITFSELRRELASQDFAPVTSELREPTMAAVAQSSRERMDYFGIDLIDVRIKRADLPTEVQQSVFARMVAERSRIANAIARRGKRKLPNSVPRPISNARFSWPRPMNAASGCAGKAMPRPLPFMPGPMSRIRAFISLCGRWKRMMKCSPQIPCWSYRAMPPCFAC